MCVFVDLFIQDGKCVRCVMSTVACPALPHFSALSHKPQDFREKVIETEMCVLISSDICLKYFSCYEELSDILSLTYTGVHLKYP